MIKEITSTKMYSWENIPDEMKEKSQWVCWHYEENKKGKTTKVPYQSKNGKNASTTDSETWSTYKQAVEAYKKGHNVNGESYDGIGFVFNDDYTGIDFDHCVNEDGTIERWAQELVDQLDTYCELSPSGTGIHGIARALLPEAINTKGELVRPGRKVILTEKNNPQAAQEIYCQGRYFTVTGDHLPITPKTIENRQEEVTVLFQELLQLNKNTDTQPKQTQKNSIQLADISDHDLVNKAMSAKDGGKFSGLWWGDCGSDHSAADQALCNLLAFWTGKDAVRMDRLFRQSGLYRGEKWDRNARSGETYGEGTIRRAIADCKDAYDPGKRIVQTTERVAKAKSTIQIHTIDKPQILLGRQLWEIRDESIEALRVMNSVNPTIFVQAARMVQIGYDECKKAIIMPMNVAEMRNALTKAADFFVMRRRGEDTEMAPTMPPKDIAESILALDPSKWPFDPLEAIIETPIIRIDGTILDKPGYDLQTKLYYAPHKDMKDFKVPLYPTQKEKEEALAVLEDLIHDFPFPGEADRANTLALMMTPIIRPAIKRHVPCAVIDAPKQGTGKGLLSDMISIIATGDSAAILTVPASDEEWDKRITSILISGATTITIDNIPSKLQSSALDAVLTATLWSGRILGVSKMIKVPQRATWIATGNNVRLGGDLARRCYRIRLDPFVSRPWMRTGFKYEDLATHVTDNREKIITAILTVVRGWYADNCPIDPTVPSLGTFTGWAKMVGSILSSVGVKGFLTNLDKLYEDMDEENAQWSNFLQAWIGVFGNRAIPTAELHKELVKESDSFAGSAQNSAGSALSESLPEYLQTIMKEKPNSFKLILGKQLEKRLETCFGDDNLRLERERDVHNKIALWKVAAGSAGSEVGPTYACKKNQNQDSYVIYGDGKDYSPHSPQSNCGEIIESEVDQPVELVQLCIEEEGDSGYEEALPAALPAEVVNLYDRYESAMPIPGKKVLWSVSSSGYVNGYISSADHIGRIRGLLLSSNQQKISLAVEEMKRKLILS